MKSHTLITLCSAITILALILSGCSTSSDTNSTTPTASASTPSAQGAAAYGLAALPGYSVSLFASQTGTTSQGSTSFFNPDALVVDNGFVYIDYQNTTAKDCTDKNTSTIVQYDMSGKMQKSYIVPGHSDGMRADPSTHLLWVTSCEDGNAKFNTLDPSSEPLHRTPSQRRHMVAAMMILLSSTARHSSLLPIRPRTRQA